MKFATLVTEFAFLNKALYPLVGCVYQTRDMTVYHQTLFIWDGTYPPLEWEFPPNARPI